MPGLIEEPTILRAGIATPSDSQECPPSEPWAGSLYLVAALLVAVAFGISVVKLGAPFYGLDDAYITIHNAQVLLSGRDASYAGTPALIGATSLAHTLEVAALTFVASPLWALEISLWVNILIYALGIVDLGLALGASRLQTIGLLFVGLLTGLVPHQLTNGLETGLAMGAIAWTLSCWLQPRRRKHLMVIAAMLPFIRPELALLTLAVAGRSIWEALRDRSAKPLSADLAPFLIALAPFALLLLWQTGSIFPTSVGAKAAYFAESALPLSTKWSWVRANLVTFASTIGLASLGLVLFAWCRAWWVGFSFIAILLGAYLIKFPGALGHYEQRYLYVVLPFAICGLGALSRRYPIPTSMLILGCAIQAAWLAPSRWEQHLAIRGFGTHELAPLGEWCNENLPTSTKILVQDAGYLSTSTTFNLIDLVGLKTPSSVLVHEQFTLPSGGGLRAFAIGEIARRNGCEVLIVTEGWDRIYRITEGLRKLGWAVRPLRNQDYYRVYAITPAQG